MVYDLTHLIKGDIQVWPGTPGPRIEELFTVATHGFMESGLHLVSHTGTHIDAPAHMLKDGLTLDRFNISAFTGLAIKIDLTHRLRVIEEEDLAVLQNPGFKVEWVLLHTGWSRYWGHPAYFGPYPVLTEKAALLLTNFSLKGIAIDAPSFDTFDSPDYPNHRRLLGKNILLVENLRGLEPLPAGHLIGFSALPLHYRKADGAPVRAMAVI
ncbi:MAG: cyclase family protein [Bacteroidales bacterium]|jgi:kynurenine formamidase|nr:cyclase family protein [Bacteroidales bacterium]